MLVKGQVWFFRFFCNQDIIFRKIDPGDIKSFFSKVDGMRSATATHVEYAATFCWLKFFQQPIDEAPCLLIFPFKIKLVIIWGIEPVFIPGRYRRHTINYL